MRQVTRMGRREMQTTFWWVNLNERDQLEDLTIDELYQNYSSRNTMEGANWVHLAYNKNKWRTLVNMVMSLRIA